MHHKASDKKDGKHRLHYEASRRCMSQIAGAANQPAAQAGT
jgi:hypothetical protein